MWPFTSAPKRGWITKGENTGTFTYRGDKKRAIFCIPGFGRYPYDWRFVARRVHQRHQVHIHGACQPDHESYQSFVRCRSWRSVPKIESEFLRFWELNDRNPVIVAGISKGALLAKILAARHPDKVRAVVAVASAYRANKLFQTMIWFGMLMQWLLAPLNLLVSRATIELKDHSEELSHPTVRARPGVTRWPASAISSILYAQILATLSLPEIQCPVLLVQCELDDFISKEVLEELAAKFATGQSALIKIKAPHVPTIPGMVEPHEFDKLVARILEFLEQVWSRPFGYREPIQREFMRRFFGRLLPKLVRRKDSRVKA